MAETKLLPCPFCGGKAKLYENQIVCGKCYCGTGFEDTQEDAIKLWNTRKPIDAVVAELERFERKSTDDYLGTDQQYDLGEMIAYGNAIDIVRNAGKDGA